MKRYLFLILTTLLLFSGNVCAWDSGAWDSSIGKNETYGSGWNADTGAPEKDDVYDYLHQIDTNDDGDVDNLDATLWATKLNAAEKAAASGVASLDGSSKVVQDPANATATPTASKIPIADGSGKLSDGWLSAYRTIFIPASACTATATNNADLATNEYATQDINMDFYAFDGATEQFIEIQFPMPEDWNRGTIKAKFFWSSASGSTATDTCEWEIAGGALSNDDAIDAALGTAQVISDALLANNGTDMQVSGATPAITIGGTPALGDLVHFKISRNVGGTDNMTEDAWLHGIWIQYLANTSVAAW